MAEITNTKVITIQATWNPLEDNKFYKWLASADNKEETAVWDVDIKKVLEKLIIKLEELEKDGRNSITS